MTEYKSDIHKDIKHFVLDMEAHGIKRVMMPILFEHVITMDGRKIHLIGYDDDTNDIVTTDELSIGVMKGV